MPRPRRWRYAAVGIGLLGAWLAGSNFREEDLALGAGHYHIKSGFIVHRLFLLSTHDVHQ
jgi:hypothetical protein